MSAGKCPVSPLVRAHLGTPFCATTLEERVAMARNFARRGAPHHQLIFNVEGRGKSQTCAEIVRAISADSGEDVRLLGHSIIVALNDSAFTRAVLIVDRGVEFDTNHEARARHAEWKRVGNAIIYVQDLDNASQPAVIVTS